MQTLLFSGLFIFSLRIVDITLYIMRIMMVVRGRKLLAWGFAFLQASVYVIAIRAVFSSLDNMYNIIGYSAGFATGLVVGMLVENRLAIGFDHLEIISPGRGPEISEALRGEGFAVTEMSGFGMDGVVTILNVTVQRREIDNILNIVAGLDANAFITSETVRSVRHGFWGKST